MCGERKSTLLAYLLWLVGGWFGLHLHYLGRDKHAVIWLHSGAALGIGWFRDLFRIPEVRGPYSLCYGFDTGLLRVTVEHGSQI